MSMSRVTAPTAVLVCSVDITRCPVRLACTAISAVSRSRISPTMTTSGSWRENRPQAPRESHVGLGVDLGLADTGQVVLDGILDREDVDGARRQLRPGRPYRVVVLPEPVGPVTRKMPCGRCTTTRMRGRSAADMPRLGSVQSSRLFVEQPQHDPFAVARRHGRHPYVHLPAADAKPDPPILGNAFFGDVEFRHDLDAGNQKRRQFALGPHDLPHHAVDAKTHDQVLLEGFDVDVGSVLPDGFRQQGVDEPDDGRIVALFEQVLGFRDRIREGWPGRVRRPCPRPSAGPRRHPGRRRRSIPARIRLHRRCAAKAAGACAA